MTTGTTLVVSWPPSAPHGATAIRELFSEYPLKMFGSPDAAISFLLQGEPANCMLIGALPPYESTIQALRRFREHQVLDDIPLLVLDPEQSTDLEVEALANGANGVLPLGSDLRLLQERVASAIRVARLIQGLRFKIDDMNDFVRTVTHDLKNPMAAIVMSSELLGWELSNANLAEVQALADSMEKCARGALTMIDELLELLRQGHTTGNFKEEDSRAVVEEAIGDLEAIIHRTKAEVRLEGEFPPIHSDRLRLVQVFSNLIGNAIKYVAPGVAPSVVVRGIDTPFSTVFCVVDNGIGVPAAERSRIFEPFVRLRDDTYDGTGIGLPIVKRIVQAHNGAVFVQSRPEGGSEFFIMLPRAGSDDAVAER